jgi:hypothetical protein
MNLWNSTFSKNAPSGLPAVHVSLDNRPDALRVELIFHAVPQQFFHRAAIWTCAGHFNRAQNGDHRSGARDAIRDTNNHITAAITTLLANGYVMRKAIGTGMQSGGGRK